LARDAFAISGASLAANIGVLESDTNNQDDATKVTKDNLAIEVCNDIYVLYDYVLNVIKLT
jgi:hypothetical protein